VGTRTLLFPTDRVVGTLNRGAWDVERGPVLARGEVTVPDDRPLHLDVRPVAAVERHGDQWSMHSSPDPVDLGFLERLPADAVQRLALNSPLVAESVGAVTHLAPGLRRLYLASTMLTDAALPAVAALTGLTYLQTWGNKFTDAGVQQLANLVHLEHLYLEEESLTAAALDFVDQLPRLRRLGLQDLSISDEELARLRARLPEVGVAR